MYIPQETVAEAVLQGINEFAEDHSVEMDYEQEEALIKYITEAVYTRLVEDEDFEAEEPSELASLFASRRDDESTENV